MGRYVLRRLLIIIPIFFCILLIVYALLELNPTDPARLILGDLASQADVDALRESMGLNRPFFIRFFSYIWDLFHGNMGTSYVTNLPVFQEIMKRLPHTLIIAVFALAFSVCVGLPIGVFSAIRQYHAIDITGQILAMFLSAMPSFFFGMLLILLFSNRLGWLPISGLGTWKNYVLPCVSLGAATLASFVRLTRSTMLDVIRQDYVRTAYSKGAKESRVIVRHCLRNALLPVVTQMGMAFTMMLGGATVVETLFSIPGVGSYVVTAVRSADAPAVMGSVVFLSLIACGINLTVDIIYAYIDPRVKSGYVTAKRVRNAKRKAVRAA